MGMPVDGGAMGGNMGGGMGAPQFSQQQPMPGASQGTGMSREEEMMARAIAESMNVD